MDIEGFKKYIENTPIETLKQEWANIEKEYGGNVLASDLVKLFSIPDVSNNEAFSEVAVCKSNSATWNEDLGIMICDECGYSHPLQTDC